MTGDYVVTLVGGSPWGFRIRGGSETSRPIHVSRINGGGKAGKYGIREGDIIEAVNGRCLSGLSQIEVQQLIRNSGDNLTLRLRRDNELLSRPLQTVDSRLTGELMGYVTKDIPLENPLVFYR
ncbi:PDZ and LIM domain protein 7-like [Centruroides sculpturatus]|uniref:PDZ and LIM domain protein 7-like n=1 Tax=Centruroides sculpturatus TaxID=218467 RepID=UPI000C6C9799|nr:PDZ and LIM domain protein 7-like [Centruroides sculpturatus]